MLRRSSRIFLSIILTNSALVSAQTPAPASSSFGYAKAQQAFADKQYRQAADLFAVVAAAESGKEAGARSDALLMQARSLVNLGDFPAADAAIRGYLQQNVRSSEALYLLGFVLQHENKPKESLEIFTRAAAIATPRPEDLRLAALDYVLLDDYIDAIHWLNRAVAGDPGSAESWYDLGRAQMHQGNFVEAERAFQRTLALNPRHTKALDNLGLSYEAQNRTEEALSAYSRAIESQTTASHPSEQPLLNYGTLLNTRNRSAEAVAPLRQAVGLAPTSSRCYEELSHAYRLIHQDGLARSSMERAVALDDTNPRLHFQLGQLYRSAGQAQKARTEFKRSAELYGTGSVNPEK
jgi:tetratricopeptide (TPR) repeat protein